MRSNQDFTALRGVQLLEKLRFGAVTQTLTGTYSIDANAQPFQFLNPGAAGRTINLPAVALGALFVITHTGATIATDLTVQSGGVTVGVVGNGEAGWFFSDGVSWFMFGGPPEASVVSGTAAPASYNTAGAITYTAADMLSGIIVRDPNGAGRTDVLPTAALLVAAMGSPNVGDVVSTLLINGADAAETITITAGAGGTFDANNLGTHTVAQNTQRWIRLRLTNVTAASEAYVIYM